MFRRPSSLFTLLGVLLLSSLVAAWMTPPPACQKSVAASSSTQLHMFDWFNPKPAPAAPKPVEEKKEEPPAAAPVVAEKEEEEPAAAAAGDDSAHAPAHEVKTGKVRWFDRNKGYGFIRLADTEDDVFVHQSEIQATGYRYLFEREDVEFGTEEDSKGIRAIHVTGPAGGDLEVTKRRKEKGREE